MQLAEFKASLMTDAAPAGLGLPLAALWHAAKGDWDRAHELAQAEESQAGAWVHAYLHRVEGDRRNAAYWYRCAGKPIATDPHQDEWERIATALLADQRFATPTS
jgi:hypothetical protein